MQQPQASSQSRAIPLGGVDQLTLFGTNDQNLKLIESLSATRIIVRNEALRIQGPPDAVQRAGDLVEHLIELTQTGSGFDGSDIRRFYEEVRSGGDESLARLEASRRVIRGTQKIIKPKTRGQDEYLRAMEENDIVVAIGPAGTGKTYLAVAMALDALQKKSVRRIILARPAVEAGETLGFLPGDLQEKVDPYLRPLYDALEDMLPADKVRRFLETRVIEIAPLAYMRGRTLADAFVILDEAQNATTKQMKMFLTRLGLNSRAVITGDVTQIDLPPREESGLLQIERILRGIDGIAFVYLTASDVVRHSLVQKILAAYEGAEAGTGADRASRGDREPSREARGFRPAGTG
ncbi:MAG TPA: PhoH family protein [Gemmatimonadota bacterium]|nr:PhoH family protein [Gemmatimonadota bacterium]